MPNKVAWGRTDKTETKPQKNQQERMQGVKRKSSQGPRCGLKTYLGDMAFDLTPTEPSVKPSDESTPFDLEAF